MSELQYNLHDVASQIFGPLSSGESEMLQNQGLLGKPIEQEAAGRPERRYTIRAKVLLWMLSDREALARVRRQGIDIWDTTISESLDLRGIHLEVPLRLGNCIIDGQIHLRDARIRSLDLTGSKCKSIHAAGSVIEGSVRLNRYFSQEGVTLTGARITGDLDCSKGTFNCGPDGLALVLDRSIVGGNVFLRNGFTANGQVRLVGATIDNSIDCRGGTFNRPLSDAKKNQGITFDATMVTVRENIFMECVESMPFTTNGRVVLDASTVKGELSFREAKFEGNEKNGLWAKRAKVEGAFCWQNVTLAPATELTLTNTTVAELHDRKSSWPGKSRLSLDGLVYDKIDREPGTTDSAFVEQRLEWLQLQDDTDFNSQPYLQLAGFLRRSGDDSGAKRVLVQKEDLRRKRLREKKIGLSKQVSRLRDSLLNWIIGYGYYPERALYLSLFFVVVGAVIFYLPYRSGEMVPDNGSNGLFNSIIYSIDVFLPVVNLHQQDLWKVSDPGLLYYWWYYWAQIMLGWLLTSLGLVAVTGLVKND